MKKLLALLLSLLIVVSLVACGVSDEDVSGTKIDYNDTNDTAEDTEEEKEFEVGTTSGLVYENAFLGYGLELSDDWSFYTEEQIKELNNITTDLAGEEFEKIAAEASYFYDMMASTSDMLSSVSVILEKGDILSVAAFDIEDNPEIINTAVDSLENIGYTDVEYTVTTKTVAGNELQAMEITSSYQGVDYYQCQLYVKAGNYLATITIGSTSTDTINDVLSSFYTV